MANMRLLLISRFPLITNNFSLLTFELTLFHSFCEGAAASGFVLIFFTQ